MGCKWRATITSWSLNRQRSGYVMHRMWSSSAEALQGCTPVQWPTLHGFKFSGRLGLLLWAIVHLALIPNRENRITLSIKWLYALATRQRASILLTGMPSQHLALDAEDAHFPMASGKGPSIAEPDAALKAAMDYYAHQLSGLPQTQELLDTKEASVADSEAAIK